MSTLEYILVFTLLGSVGSLIGGMVLLAKEKFALRISHFLTAFAAGVLLGAAFFDLLPEAALEASEDANIFFWVLVGIITLFLVERSIHWFHHHQQADTDAEKKSVIPLVIISDTAHNFIDGIVIALTFLVNPATGIITSLAVIAHEIPQEIGDFGILLQRGMRRKKIILVNIISAFAAVIGAIIAYSIGESIEAYLPAALATAAGFFIYIAASDLIPEIHNEDNRKVAFIETFLLLFGVFLIWLLTSQFEHH